MARSIKLFEKIQKICQMIGLYQAPSQLNQNDSSNCKKFIVIMSLAFLLIATIAFMLYEAQTIEDYVAGFLTSTLAITILAYFLIFAVEIKNIIMLIGKFEDFIEMSKPSQDQQCHFNTFFTSFFFISLIGIRNGGKSRVNACIH